ncbi:MAG: WxcM-like domain-containing protein [Lysobacteraceae bacterium]
MTVFVHPQALCESDAVGEGTRVWAFAHVLPGARVGRDCNLCDGVFVEGGALIGDRVTIKCGVQVWDGVQLHDDVFVGPNATFSNDPFPRSRQRPARFTPTVVERGASIGANATVLPGVVIGSGAMVGAGAVVTRSVPANAIVIGNPARIVGYVGAGGDAPLAASDPVPVPAASRVAGVRLIALPQFEDMRGRLAVMEFADHLPFVPQRCFFVHAVPSREVRGEHAHRHCEQALICLHGSLSVLVDDGRQRDEHRLDSPALALYLPPLVWGAQYRYSEDAVLMVLASLPYDADDYLRSYPEFLAAVQGR